VCVREREEGGAGSGFSSAELHSAYLDCRRRKRRTPSALRFELNLAANLLGLEEDLNTGTYQPSRSACFVTTRPKPREIFAADFRDRVVHHLLVRQLEPYWERVFIHDSYACRKGRGTHAGVERLESFVRSATRGGRRRAWFLQLDVDNFFMSIDRQRLFELLDRGMRRQFGVPDGKLPLFCRDYQRYLDLRRLAETTIFHNPTGHFARRSPREAWRRVPDRKSLFGCSPGHGLPIGNLPSQFLANVYLNPLDQFVKHTLKAHHYLRYVDDVVLVHEEPGVLRDWLAEIERFLADHLGLALNPRATRLKPVSCGINFLGYVVHPTHRLVRRRVAGSFAYRLEALRERLVSARDGVVTFRYHPGLLERLLATVNSYLAHFAKASGRTCLSKLLARHAWLNAYLVVEGDRAERAWRPPSGFKRFSRQLAWFRAAFPGVLLFVQVGRFHELYGDQARWAADNLGLCLLAPRFGRVPRAGVTRFSLHRVMQRATALGKPALTVIESGYRLYDLQDRQPGTMRLPLPKNACYASCSLLRKGSRDGDG
jgi:retron-type reverse transcriptase